MAFGGSYGINISVLSNSIYWSGLYDSGAMTPNDVNTYIWTKVSMSPDDKVPVFCDSNWCDIQGMNVIPPLPSAFPLSVPNFSTGGSAGLQRVCLNRHSGAVNIAFKDGSASTIRLKQLWDLRWNRQTVPLTKYVFGLFPSH